MLIGYGRVSTLDQSPELQADTLTAAGCERLFIEKASGARMRGRPELESALSHLRKGDTLVVWKLDRLGRSLRDLIDTMEKLAERGIELRSLTEAIDTGTPGGRLVFHIFGAMAEFELSLIRERTYAGLKAARDRGRVGGRPRKLSEADKVAALALLSDPAIPFPQVAKRVGASTATLYRAFPGGRSGLS
jgi:DNA invertase Pin-like site-specific DNA recombinase